MPRTRDEPDNRRRTCRCRAAERIIDRGAAVGATLFKEEAMASKNKSGPKGGESRTKNPTRPEPIQTRSSSNLERGQVEREESKITETKTPKEGHSKSGKK